MLIYMIVTLQANFGQWLVGCSGPWFCRYVRAPQAQHERMEQLSIRDAHVWAGAQSYIQRTYCVPYLPFTALVAWLPASWASRYAALREP